MAVFLTNLFTPISRTPQFLSLNPISISKPLLKFAPLSLQSLKATTFNTLPLFPALQDFGDRVSGEWDGFGAEFSPSGDPVELPENVVPDAFREWGVQVFDWQTQCPTIFDIKEDPLLRYKLIKLLPTVGCEADAATRYNVEERVAGGPETMARALGFDKRSGSYVTVWKSKKTGKLGEIEHCLVDPWDSERRVRVVQVLGAFGLGGIRVFCENWEGPYRNGESVGGCAVKEAAFAATEKVGLAEVVGVWEGMRVGAAGLETDVEDIFHELIVEESYKTVRDKFGIVTLPKKLWCSIKENEDGLRLCEVGWILNQGQAMISSCVFDRNGKLKEVTIGHEKAIAEEI